MQNGFFPGTSRSRGKARSARKSAFVAFLVAGLSFTSLPAFASSVDSVDVNQPLGQNADLTPWVLTGTVTPAIVEEAEDTPRFALRLTNKNTTQNGFALYNTPIPVGAGLDIRFSFAQFGGDGADGIVFFIKDGANASTAAGTAGGSLGYSPGSTGGDGIAAALLGIGFDAWGNFGTTLAQPSDSACTNTPALSGTATKNSIVVRGPGTGRIGYCVIDGARYVIPNGKRPLWANGYTTRQIATNVGRVVIDPANIDNARARVFYNADLVIDIPLPVEFKNVTNIKFGFAAGTGGSTNFHDVWGVSTQVAPNPVVISTLSLPNGRVNGTYSARVEATGGTGTFSYELESGELPDGATLNADGTITGVTTIGGTFTFVVRAVDSDGIASTREYTLTIEEAPFGSSGQKSRGDTREESVVTAPQLAATGVSGPMAMLLAVGGSTIAAGVVLTSTWPVTRRSRFMGFSAK